MTCAATYRCSDRATTTSHISTGRWKPTRTGSPRFSATSPATPSRTLRPDGHVEILASADGDRVRFEVIDDGPGIDPDEAAHLFERFYRSPEARGRDRDGSGLGLAIAQAIVDAHGGQIWADPAYEGGARLAVELPGYRPGAMARP